MNWYLMVWKRYAEFQGRSRRKEFWMFLLFNFIISLIVQLLCGVESLRGIVGILYAVYNLALIIPMLALYVRRLHDTGKSGWFFLLIFIPIVNLYLLYLCCKAGDIGNNAYGADPKALQ